MKLKSLFMPCFVAFVAFFLAWSPSNDWQDEHYNDEPFEWPESLVYKPMTGAEGLKMQVITAGPPPAESKGVILFAHGFPESASSWKDYLLHYAGQGYHVLAPDQRNVNTTIASSNVLTLDLLADDLLALLKATGQSKAIVVGHDWGSGSVWSFAIKYPEHTSALITLAVPHLELYRAFNMFNMPFALKHVWYFMFYGLTGPLSRWKAGKDDFAWFEKFSLANSDPKTFSKAEAGRLKDMWRRTIASETNSPMTGWYLMGNLWLLKSVLPSFMLSPGLVSSMWDDGQSPSRVPTLQLLPGRDKYIDPGMHGFASNPEYVAHPYTRTVIFDASHWLNHEKKAEVMSEMDTFIAGLPRV